MRVILLRERDTRFIMATFLVKDDFTIPEHVKQYVENVGYSLDCRMATTIEEAGDLEYEVVSCLDK